MELENKQPVPAPEVLSYSVPWKFSDNWVGVALLALIDGALFALTLRGAGTEIAQSAAILLLESVYLLPVVLIFAWRHIHWKYLGFRKFEWKTLGLGCGLLIAGRFYFRVRTDTDQIFDIYYDRAMKNVDDRKGQWFIYRELAK